MDPNKRKKILRDKKKKDKKREINRLARERNRARLEEKKDKADDKSAEQLVVTKEKMADAAQDSSGEQPEQAQDGETTSEKAEEREPTWLEKKLGLKPGQKLRLNVFGKNQVVSPAMVDGKLQYLPERDQLDPTNSDDLEVLKKGLFIKGQLNPDDPYRDKGYPAIALGEVKAYVKAQSKGNSKTIDKEQQVIFDENNNRFLYPTAEKDEDGETIYLSSFTDATEDERLSGEFVTDKAIEASFTVNDKLERAYDLAMAEKNVEGNTEGEVDKQGSEVGEQGGELSQAKTDEAVAKKSMNVTGEDTIASHPRAQRVRRLKGGNPREQKRRNRAPSLEGGG